jgi:hypothetical protein
VNHFCRINNQSGVLKNEYRQYRVEPLREIHQKIQQAMRQMYDCHIQGADMRYLEYLQAMVLEMKQEYKQRQDLAEEQIFNYLNTRDHIHLFIDLHG